MSSFDDELGLVDSHRSYLKRLAEGATSDIYDLVSRGSSPGEIRDIALEVVPGYMLNLEELTIESATQMYTGIRSSQRVPGEVYRRVRGVDPLQSSLEASEGSIRAIAGSLFKDDPQKFYRDLSGMINRRVFQESADTIEFLSISDRYKPKFARIPEGSVTCSFCTMLASRGFEYHSARSAGSASKFHDHCNCMVVPSWDNTEGIGEYDFSPLKEIYVDARNSLPRSDWYDFSKLSSRARELHPGKVSDGNIRGFDYVPASKTSLKSWGGSPPNNIKDIISGQGWVGKVERLDVDKFKEAVIKSKYPQLYRGIAQYNGVKPSSMQNAFLDNPLPWVGNGVKGRGWYFTSNLNAAQRYAKILPDTGKLLPNELAGDAGLGDQVLEAVLKPEARVASLSDLSDMGIDINSPELSEKAALAGFDAIELISPRYLQSDERYFVVVNRTALVAKYPRPRGNQ